MDDTEFPWPVQVNGEAIPVTGTPDCLLSILLPALKSRRTLCSRLCRNLEQQAARAGRQSVRG